MTVLYICPDSTLGGSTQSLLSMIESTRGSVEPVVLFMHDGIACKVFREQGIECIVFPYIKLHLFPQKYSWKQRLHHPSHFRIVTLYREEKACVKHVKEYLGDRHIDIVHSNYSSILIGWGWLAYSFVIMVILMLIGTVVFNKVQKSFMDTV